MGLPRRLMSGVTTYSPLVPIPRIVHSADHPLNPGRYISGTSSSPTHPHVDRRRAPAQMD